MKTIPTDVLLSWPAPNYKNPHTQGQSLVITNIVFMSLTMLVVSLRYYSRLRNHKWLGSDDIFIGLALIFSLLLGAVVILANVRYGWDRHIWDVKPTQYEGASLVAFLAKIIFTLASTFTRISLICFYFRLIRDSGHSRFRWVLWFNVGWQVAVCVTFIFETVFLCGPVDAYWDVDKMSTAKCLDEGTVTVIAGIINCVSDFMITILPIPIIMRLNMPLKQRIGVCVLLSIGIVVTVAGILRTYFIWKALISTYDETWYSYRLWICATVEIDLAVLCACVPALKPLVSPSIKAFRSLNRSHHDKTHRDNTTTTLGDRNASIGSHTLHNKDGSVETKMKRIESNTTGSSQAAILHEKQDREDAYGSWATGKGLGWFSWQDDDHNDVSRLERGDSQGYGQAIRMSTSAYHIADRNFRTPRDEDDDGSSPIGSAYTAEDRYTGQGILREESFAVSARPR